MTCTTNTTAATTTTNNNNNNNNNSNNNDDDNNMINITNHHQNRTSNFRIPLSPGRPSWSAGARTRRRGCCGRHPIT